MIDAMKQALEALEELMPTGAATLHLRENAITTLRQAIAEAEKESTLQEISDIGQWNTSDMAHRPNGLSVEQKPVAWDDDAWGKAAQEMSGDFVKRVKANWESAPKREWVGLTDEESEDIYNAHHNTYGECITSAYDLVLDVEAKLRERNT